MAKFKMTVQQLIDVLMKVENKEAWVMLARDTDTDGFRPLADVEDDVLAVYSFRDYHLFSNEPADEDWAGPDEDAEPAICLWPMD